MRGHGSTVVGTSIEQAVYRAIYAEVNARLQLQATQLGDVTYLNRRGSREGGDGQRHAAPARVGAVDSRSRPDDKSLKARRAGST